MDNYFSKKQINFLFTLLYIVLGAVLIYLIATTVLRWLLPFIIAYILAYLTNPIVCFLERKIKLPRKLASLIVILLTVSLIISVLSFIVYRIVYEVKELAENLPAFLAMLALNINVILDKGISAYVSLPVEVSQFIDTVITGLSTNLTSIIGPLTDATTRFAYIVVKSFPSIFVFTIVLIISTYFISSDKKIIDKFIVKQIPTSWAARIVSVKNDLSFALLGYIKAQLILMSITFVEISIGLVIIGVNYSITFGLLIALIDALPIFGTGTILIPWAIGSLIIGDVRLAFSLIVLYAICLFVRQLLEPKIVGTQIGVYPLVTLISMYVGLQVFGIIGMILGPILILIIRNLQKAGLFRLWRE